MKNKQATAGLRRKVVARNRAVHERQAAALCTDEVRRICAEPANREVLHNIALCIGVRIAIHAKPGSKQNAVTGILGPWGRDLV